jgi:hypothetical protein
LLHDVRKLVAEKVTLLARREVDIRALGEGARAELHRGIRIHVDLNAAEIGTEPCLEMALEMGRQPLGRLDAGGRLTGHDDLRSRPKGEKADGEP